MVNYYNEYRCRLKFEVLSYYGGNPPKCECCGEDFIEFLSIDHIDGGGSVHRKKIGGNSRLYNWLKKNNFPEGFRVFCLNCNLSRGFWGYCPHECGSKFRVIETISKRVQNAILTVAKDIFSKGIYPTMGMVAELSGTSKQVVCKYRKKFILTGEWPCSIRGYVHRGEDHPNAVLDVVKVKKIKKMLYEGYSIKIISNKLGVNRTTIRDIKVGNTWKHI
jgi:hypothetical protein